MNPEWIETLSKKSASKYRNTSHYDDLISEGVLAAYEELSDNPEATEQRLYQVINWAQWKFLNVDSLPVYMPEKLVRIAKGMWSEGVHTNYTEENLEWAKVILSQGQFRSEYHDTDVYSDQAEVYEVQALVKDVWEAAEEYLTEEEYDLFYSYFEQQLNGEELGLSLGITRQAVNLKVKKVSEKVRKHLLNKKWEL